MKNFAQDQNNNIISENDLSSIVGGKKPWGKWGGLAYTLLGEFDDFKKGFKYGVKH